MEAETNTRNYCEILKSQLASFHSSKQNLYTLIALTFLLKSSINFVVYLSSVYYIEVWDLSDRTAGYFICLDALQIVFTFAAGNIIDRIGIRNAYILISIFGFAIYSCLLLLKNLVLHIILISCLLGLETVLIFTTLKTSITLASDYSNRSFSFSMLNVATQLSSIVFGLAIKLIFNTQGVNTTAFNLIFCLTLTFFLISLILVLTLINPESSDLNSKSWNSFSNIKEALNMKRFWKLMLLNVISAIPLSMVYTVGMILPIYMDRELDDSSNYGLFIIAYSLCVILFCFTLNPVFTYYRPYTFLIVSSGILAIAPLIFVISNGYFSIAVYIVVTALGSSIFETRLTEYHGVASMPGMRGTYISLVNVAYSVAFLITGLSSGFTLDAFCPENGSRSCWIMWVICSIIGFTGNFLLIALRDFLEYKYDSEEPDPYIYSKDKY